jgi:hypothetical protein
MDATTAGERVTAARPPLAPVEYTAGVAADAACLNCGAVLRGPFCSACGQRVVPPYPTLRELAGDAFVEFSGWDGKFAETLRALLWHPGRLTREFISGRRVRFISPVRLYLTLSVVYFVLAASAPSVRPGKGVGPSVAGISIGVERSTASGPGQVSRAALDARDEGISPAERDSALSQIAHAPKVLRPVLTRAVQDPAGFKSNILRDMPRVLFLLLPVFAGIVALFYRNRNYPEHLYFAVHLHAFVFLAMSLAEVAKFTHLVALATLMGVGTTLWIVAYTVASLRRVYGGSIAATLAKSVGIGALYMCAGTVAILGLAFWAAVAT